jgi:hypothetical protein
LLDRKIAALLDQHHDALYGVLAPHVQRLSRHDLVDPALTVKTWRGGFADTAWIQATLSDLALPDAFRRMRELPIARFVRRLEIGSGDQVQTLAMITPETMPWLRELVVGDTSRWIPRIETLRPSSTALFAAFIAQLEVLEVHGGINFETFAAPKLRRLTLWQTREPRDPPLVVFDANTPALEELFLIGFLPDLAFLGRYPKLRVLSLNTTFDDNWLEALVRSPMIEHLEHVTLGYNLRDPHLEIIIRYADRLRHLKILDLTGNYFRDEVRRQFYDVGLACVRLR